MRKATFAGLVFVVCGYAATAQLTLTPKAGIESITTCLKGLDATSSVAPQLNARLDYQFNKLHGPFVGLATNRVQEGFSFENGKVKASETKTRLRMEAGYMVSVKATPKLRVQPFAGMAFGNNSSFISGANLLVGKFVVGAQYLQVLDNKRTDVMVMENEGGALSSFKSNVSAFNVTVGVPLVLTKAKKAAPAVKKEAPKKSCSYYRTRCGKWQ